ncbi:helix-turn-helix domain-containing protein [Paenibacillus larvae]
MKPSERIRKLRRALDLTGADVAEKLGISTQYYYNIERGRRKLSAEVALKLAEIFGVSLDFLMGNSIGSLIEKRLDELGMTIEELAKLSNVREDYIRNIEHIMPDPGEYERGDKIYRIAKALKMDFNKLSAAYARQEPPLSDEVPRGTLEELYEELQDEDFEDVDLSNNVWAKFDKTIDVEKVKKEAEVIRQADEALKSIGTTVFDMVLESLEEEDILKLAARTIGYKGTLTKEQIEQMKLAMKIALAKSTN